MDTYILCYFKTFIDLQLSGLENYDGSVIDFCQKKYA